MATLTDPARELAEVCEKLAHEDPRPGDAYLSERFSSAPWSKEFFQVVFCILERADYLGDLINELDLDDDFKAEAIAHVRRLKGAFGRGALIAPWETRHSNSGPSHLGKQQITALKMLSPQVRKLASYPKLDAAEIAELLQEVSIFQTWLEEHQLVEQDFIRQAILEGTKQFAFRLERFDWLGWGYATDSLREVIGAYYALQCNLPDSQASPVAAAMLQKVEALVKKIYDKASGAKDVYETGDFMLKAYGAYKLLLPNGIAGLLT
ncbi:hypothetical protein [Sinorhizobium fredii]|uniref:hypothetical protein n=1 Tax=Rhizobium fredii TaxID=380 RepID=UPI0035138EE1